MHLGRPRLFARPPTRQLCKRVVQCPIRPIRPLGPFVFSMCGCRWGKGRADPPQVGVRFAVGRAAAMGARARDEGLASVPLGNADAADGMMDIESERLIPAAEVASGISAPAAPAGSSGRASAPWEERLPPWVQANFLRFKGGSCRRSRGQTRTSGIRPTHSRPLATECRT